MPKEVEKESMTEASDNYFERLCSVKCVTEKRKSGGTDLTYVSWADAWAEVKKLHPDANYHVYENAEGFPFWSSKYGIDVKVGVTINGIEHIVRLPVMDGANKAMKDAKYTYLVKKRDYGTGNFTEVEKSVDAADAFDINKTIQRAFTKAIAMHGIGLYVYRGEDLPIVEEEPEKKPKKVEKATAPVNPEDALNAAHAAEKASGKLLSDAQLKKVYEVWESASLPAEVLAQRKSSRQTLDEICASKFDAQAVALLTPTNAERVISMIVTRNNTYSK